MKPLLLLTGFGAFEKVDVNASGLLARAFESRSVPGIELWTAVLPVSFRRAPEAWDELLACLESRRPSALLGMGVQKKPTFRLEARARRVLTRTDRPDVDGVPANACVGRGPDLLETAFDLEALRESLIAAGAAPEEVTISEDAGGYVCERSYHHLLLRAGELGVPGLFLHLPPVDAVPIAQQERVVAGLLPALVGT